MQSFSVSDWALCTPPEQSRRSWIILAVVDALKFIADYKAGAITKITGRGNLSLEPWNTAIDAATRSQETGCLRSFHHVSANLRTYSFGI